MTLLKVAGIALTLCTLCGQAGYTQGGTRSISLDNLDAFREPGKNWVIASDAKTEYTKDNDMKPVKGSGIVVNTFARNDQMHLFTKDEFGDIDVELDFMMAKNSNSGVYLQGRYEIQLLDSWKRTDPTTADVGAVYARWTADRKAFEGTPPVMNVGKAPGLWQHLRIVFRAPKFNEKGEKIANARFEKVYLNGVLVQQEVAVTGPTASAMFPNDEKAKGPLVIQGDHGPVAIRNIRYNETIQPHIVPEGDQYWKPHSDYWNALNPITVEPCDKPAFIKTFLMYGDKKLTHVLSVGHPGQVNYSYNVKSGALFQVWRGKFIDVTRAWWDRGGMQLGVPMGSVTVLSNAPFIAALNDDNAAWPDSVAFDDMNNKGYVLDKQRSPTFSYVLGGMEVSDNIVINNDGDGITRTVTVNNAGQQTYARIVTAGKIEKLNDNLYAVDDKEYYLQIDKKFKPVIRTSASGQEMLVKYSTAGPVNYSLIW